MRPERLTEILARLERLDERYAYRLRSRSVATLGASTPQKLEERMRDLAAYTLELSELTRELLAALGARPAAPGSGS